MGLAVKTRFGHDESFFTDSRRPCAPRSNGDDALPFDPWFAFTTAEQAPAKALCRRCPVMEACGAWALIRPGVMGVWGGMSAMERSNARKRNPALEIIRGV